MLYDLRLLGKLVCAVYPNFAHQHSRYGALLALRQEKDQVFRGLSWCDNSAPGRADTMQTVPSHANILQQQHFPAIKAQHGAWRAEKRVLC